MRGLAPSRGRGVQWRGILVGAAITVTAARDARAQIDAPGPGTEPEPPPVATERDGGSEKSYPLELGGRVRYSTAPIRGGVNPFGAGFGARLGYAFSGVYVGVTALYYFGGSDVGATDRALLFGAELGYGVPLGEYVTLRPMIGVGDAALSHTEPLAHSTVDVVTSASGSSSSSSNSVTTTGHNVYVEPGVIAMLASGAHFAALDVGARILPAITYGPAPAQQTTWLSYSIGVQLGFRF